ncbi:putative secondary metabolism biosynthetic enzyme [Arthroderma sp. PD_2]|nr:putative secondary metabolism biosynthetic enzyme [Arthroderma sp. PD_2]
MLRLPSKQIALLADGPGRVVVSTSTTIPKIDDDEVLIQTKAVALNPVDAKSVEGFNYPGTVVGFDFAGVVVAVGAQATDRFVSGDRLCGSTHGMNPLDPETGAFAEYVKTVADTTIKIPEWMSFEEAATMATGVGAVGLVLKSLGLAQFFLENPRPKPLVVLVYGGSSATGTLAIQMLKICGLRIITTCSPVNFDLVRSRGAEEVFDYHSTECIQDIRQYTRNSLSYVVDCISTTDSMTLCYAAMGRLGGRYAALEPHSKRVMKNRPTVKADWIFQPSLFGKKIAWEEPYAREEDPELRQFGREIYLRAQDLVQDGRLKPHPAAVKEGGIPAVVEGLEIIKTGALSGQKLVYRI